MFLLRQIQIGIITCRVLVEAMHFVAGTALLAMDPAEQTVGVMTRIAVTAVTTIAFP